ncbi:MAG: hypothetical protein ACUVRG_02020 [Ignavibacterium sp.]|uniref:hypothetical protein n=1 Tax=Ignavibacterium sp. TaxID=2651167 RepID=UPI00404A4E6C
MASIIRTYGLKLAKSLGIVVFLFLILFNIKLILSDNNSDFSFLGLTIELNETKAAPTQDFRMSLSLGCICGRQQGGYWASCHLPGKECNIMECTCFDF